MVAYQIPVKRFLFYHKKSLTWSNQLFALYFNKVIYLIIEVLNNTTVMAKVFLAKLNYVKHSLVQQRISPYS